MKILLHICCGPCSIYPFSELIKDARHSVTGFFYNPNIHPAEEMSRRTDALRDYASSAGLAVIFADYDPEEYFAEIGGHTDKPLRCGICWRIRLQKTAEYGCAGGYDAFTTTLLVSPYQDREEIISIGGEIESRMSIRFMAIDFREGFRAAQQQAREKGIYRQKYCGCVYSQRG